MKDSLQVLAVLYGDVLYLIILYHFRAQESQHMKMEEWIEWGREDTFIGFAML